MNAHRVRSRRSVSLELLEKRVLFVRVEGIDVSQFQGVIDWSQVAASGKQFTFMRASRTNLDKDPTFETNAAGAVAAGLLVGPYHFVLPNSFGEAGPETDPIADAQKFYAAAGHIMTTGYLPPVIDAEAGSTLGKAELSRWVNKFSDEIVRLTGVTPIVYANSNYAKNFLDETVSATHALWLARYNAGNDPTQVDPQVTQPETPSGYPNAYGSWNEPVGGPPSNDSWSFWQYSSRGDGPSFGVSSTFLDLDLFNGSLEELKERFMIGFQKNYGTAGNTPFAISPGTTTSIEAENYDVGGQDVSYHDESGDGNAAGVYRIGPRQAVDLTNINGVPNGVAIADAKPGEYVEYTVDVAQAANYQLAFRVAQTMAGGAMHVEVDGQASSTISVPSTIGFNTFGTANQNVSLSAGKHVLRVVFDTAAPNGEVARLDRIDISESPPVAPPPPPPDPSVAQAAALVRGGLFSSQNFGAAPDLAVQRGRGGANTYYSYLRFDLTDVGSIASAKLQLTGHLSDTAAPSLTTGVYSIGREKTPWQENAISFKKKPAPKKLRGSITVSGTSNGTYELDLTNFLMAEFAAGRKIVTLVLKNVTKSVTTQTVFASNESTNPPKLVIT
jgi:GH25 family lysozyme M1 (1,4-beta-N-acetylmuramidase)